MRNPNIIGKTFALTGAKVWTDPENEETRVSGLYMVEDIVYPDRTCGQYEGGLMVFPAECAGKGDGPMFFIDNDTFFEQTDPQGYGRMLVQEREIEWHAKDFDREYGDLFGSGDPIDDIERIF